jgi:hypothetical protein
MKLISLNIFLCNFSNLISSTCSSIWNYSLYACRNSLYNILKVKYVSGVVLTAWNIKISFDCAPEH